MKYCEHDSETLTCKRCGHKARRLPTYRECVVRPGLGDMVASGLAAVGITKERAQAVAQAAGLKDCGCSQRQQMLNALGNMVGIGKAPADPPPPAAQ